MGPLIEAVENLCQFASSPEFASVPAKISEEGREAQMPIFDSGKQIIAGSCAMIQSAKSPERRGARRDQSEEKRGRQSSPAEERRRKREESGERRGDERKSRRGESEERRTRRDTSSPPKKAKRSPSPPPKKSIRDRLGPASTNGSGGTNGSSPRPESRGVKDRLGAAVKE